MGVLAEFATKFAGSVEIWSVAADVGLQIGLDKAVQVAIQHALGITGFMIGTVIFDHLVGMQHIRTDLTAPFSFGVLSA